MGRIKGITVILYSKKKVGKDPFGSPIYEEVQEPVDNVLVSPTLSDDVTNQLSITGRKAVYTLGIPKGDTHNWENQKVEFFGQGWKTFGIPTEGIESMIPLEWNKKVLVERYE